MSELLFGYVSAYGLPVIFVATFLSCLAVPIPTFAVMLAGGAFAAAGDLVLWQVVLAALAGAIAGDQTGFQIGRWGGQAVITRIQRNPRFVGRIERARASMERWGGLGVFFSTWLFAVLGPWVNLMAGAGGMGRARFSAWDAAGEAIWVTIYVSLGFLFGARLGELAELLENWSGVVSSVVITVILGAVMVKKLRKRW